MGGKKNKIERGLLKTKSKRFFDGFDDKKRQRGRDVRQVELAGLTGEAVFAGIKISFAGLVGREGQWAAACVMLVSILGGKSSADKS
jgi:hypothetical protein